MPWQELLPMDLRMRFIADWQTGGWPMTELCATYQVSRKTGYKWVARYRARGPQGLHDQSRRPHHSPSATAPDVVAALVTARRQHPRWGPRKLLRVLRRRQPTRCWPARSTVCALLKAEGLVQARRRRSRPGAPSRWRAPITAPNQVWTTDFKGEFRTGDGVYCYPLTIRDAFSRFVLRCDALRGPTYEATRAQFRRAFAAYGLPARIRSDNGTPFAGSGLVRLSRLAVWWLRLGIGLDRIAPGHPEQNGAHEQFHAVLKAHTARPPARHAAAQQQRFRRFCTEYNHERPHEALGDEPPAHYYRPSPRPLPRHLPPVVYPGHFAIRRVSPIGQVSWNRQLVFLSAALAGEDVGFEEVDDGLWTVYFVSLPLGRFDARHRRLQRIAPFSEGALAGVAGSRLTSP
jgi:transposase InsO family protein